MIANIRGLTILELLMVTAIVAVLAAVAYPQFKPDRLAAAARTMHGDLAYARTLAINRRASVRVIFDLADGNGGVMDTRYKIHRDADDNGEIDPGEEVTNRDLQTDFTGISFSANRGAAVFSPLGTSNSGTITLTDGSDAKRVIFSWTGRIRISDEPGA